MIKTRICAWCEGEFIIDPENLGNVCCSKSCGRFYSHNDKRSWREVFGSGTVACRKCDNKYPVTKEFFEYRGNGTFRRTCKKCDNKKHRDNEIKRGEAHKEKKRLSSHQRRCLIRSYQTDVTTSDLHELYSLQEKKCGYCNIELDEYHIEHIIPISRGGKHILSNICLVCPHCNLSKGSNLFEEWKTDKKLEGPVAKILRNEFDRSI